MSFLKGNRSCTFKYANSHFAYDFAICLTINYYKFDMRSHKGGFVFLHFQGVGSFYTKKKSWIAKVKWLFHSKIIVLSSFTHPYVVAKLNEILSFVEHKRKYFEIFFFFFVHIMEISGNQNVLVANILQNLFCWRCRRNKVLHAYSVSYDIDNFV